MRNTYKLRDVHAARWLSDAMACVAVNEKDCHASEYLTHTLNTLLDDSTWHAVKYVPAHAQECPRVLDWPSDCGWATQASGPGECHVRQ